MLAVFAGVVFEVNVKGQKARHPMSIRTEIFFKIISVTAFIHALILRSFIAGINCLPIFRLPLCETYPLGAIIWHWLILLLIVALVFGTKKLKNIGGDVGGAVNEFKKAMKENQVSDGAEKVGTTVEAEVTNKTKQ